MFSIKGKITLRLPGTKRVEKAPPQQRKLVLERRRYVPILYAGEIGEGKTP